MVRRFDMDCLRSWVIPLGQPPKPPDPDTINDHSHGNPRTGRTVESHRCGGGRPFLLWCGASRTFAWPPARVAGHFIFWCSAMNGMESRPASPSPLGKCDRKLELTISEALEERLIAMAAFNGIPKATYARQVLERAMFGDFIMLRMVANQRGIGNPDNSGSDEH